MGAIISCDVEHCSPDVAACGVIRESVDIPGLRRKRLHPGYA